MKKTRFAFSVAVKLLSAAAFFYGTAKTFEGLQTFTKFTYLSGAFSVAAIILSLCFDAASFSGADVKKPQTVYIMKYCSCLSSLLTFVAYMTAMAPFSERGFFGAYLGGDGASLCLHAALPILSSADFFAFDGEYAGKNIHVLIACVFPSAYAALIFSLSAAGVTWNGAAAPYSFLDYSSSAGWFGVEFPLSGEGNTDIGTAYVLFSALVLFIAAGKIFLKISLRIRAVRAKNKAKTFVYRLSFVKSSGEKDGNRRIIIDERGTK